MKKKRPVKAPKAPVLDLQLYRVMKARSEEKDRTQAILTILGGLRRVS